MSIPHSGETPLIEARNICKSFGAVKALQDLTISINRGRVHGLVGANGAGKSTFLNIVGGIIQPDEGTLLIDGMPSVVSGPRRASKLGFSFIYQELALVPDFSVWENMTLRMPPTTPFGLGEAKLRRRIARSIADKLHLRIDLEQAVRKLSAAERGLVAIARALVSDARFIAMDEPTASLSDAECERLFQVIKELRDGGVAVAYVSHRLDEIEELSDQVTVFKNGEIVSRFERGGYNRDNLVAGIVGDQATAGVVRSGSSRVNLKAEPLLEVHNLARPARVKDISFKLFPGEILGLAGLVGAGRTELVRLIFGADKASSGHMRLSGSDFTPANPRDAIARGIALVPEERRSEGLVMEESITFNAMMGNVSAYRWKRTPLVDDRKCREAAISTMQRLSVKANSPASPMQTLSGGNQQKVVIGRWLLRNSKILLLDEPSRGVDIGARRQIWQVIEDFASGGGAALVISSELEELEVCDRVVVMAEGRSIAELQGEDISVARMLELIYSVEEDHVW